MFEFLYHWSFWVGILVLGFLICWLLWGRRKVNFVGLAPLNPINSPIGEPNLDNIFNYSLVPINFDQPPTIEVEGKIEPPPAEHKSYGFHGKMEDRCRQILEAIYHKPFPTVRPNFLKNPETNRNLEIDCFNEELKIGLEYSASQHYIFPNHFHRTREEFIQQVRRDRFKLETCDRQGIYLIVVPYTVKEADLLDYIVQNLPPPDVQNLNLSALRAQIFGS